MTRAICRGLVAWWLRRMLPPHALSAAMGDLEEEFASRAGNGRLRAEWWMLCEAASLAHAFRREGRGPTHASPPRRQTLDELRQGLRDSLRSLRRAPGYTVLASLSLGLAVAAVLGTAVISDLVLRRPVASADATRVHRLAGVTTAGTSLAFSFPELAAITAAAGPADLVGAASLTPAVVRIDNVSVQDLIDATVGPFHQILGRSALRGRLLTRDDDVPGRPRVVVVSEAFWRARLFASESVIGRHVAINNLDYVVVGVAPSVPSLGFFGVSAAGWVPSATADSLLNRGWRTNPGDRAFVALLKTAGEEPLEAITSRLAAANADLAREVPNRWRDRRLTAVAGDLVIGPLRRSALVIAALLSAMAGLLLLVAASNVGGLVYAQAALRRRALAIKAALGARPSTLVVGTLAEGLLLGLLAMMVAVVLYLWLAGAAQTFDLLPTVTWRLDLPRGWRIIGLAGALSLLAGLATTVMPALSAARQASARSPGSLGERRGGDAVSGRARRWLLGAQVAAAVVLLVCAALFTRSLDAVHSAPLGVDMDRLAAFDFDIEPPGVAPGDLPALARHAVDRVRALPGVASVAMASRSPVDQSTPSGDVRVVIDSRDTTIRDVTRLAVTPEYFDTVGVRLLGGRAFSAADASRPVAIVNETLAERLAGGTTVVDIATGDAFDVIGVVSNAKYRSPTEPPQPHFYTASMPQFHLALLVRAHGDPAALFGEVQRALDGAGPGVQGFFPRTGRDQLRPALLPALVSAAVARALGLVAGGLATVGLFGLLSWLVHARRHEWSLRVAVGAAPADLRRLVFLQAWRATWPGVLAGVAGAALLGWAARGQLFGVTLLDPIVLATIPIMVIVLVFAGSWLPARRAARTPVLELLR